MEGNTPGPPILGASYVMTCDKKKGIELLGVEVATPSRSLQALPQV